MTDRLLRSDSDLRPLEALVAALLLALLGLLAYGAFVGDGGFYSDDWSHAANYHFAESPRYLNAFEQQQEFLGGRPLSAALMPVPQAIFGPDPTPHLALAVVIGVLLSLCLFVLLRTMRMAPLHAGLIAALVLLFPWADSSRLWATGSVNSVSVAFFLLGLTVALRGFDHSGRRGTMMHAAAAILYLLSVLTYEVTASAALLAGLLYLDRAPRPVALRAWAADAVAVFAALLYSLLATASSRPVATVRDRLEDVPDFVRESFLLLSSALQPFGSMGRPLPGYHIALLDPDGKPAPEGEVSVLLTPRPAGLMTSYVGEDERTRTALSGTFSRPKCANDRRCPRNEAARLVNTIHRG